MVLNIVDCHLKHAEGMSICLGETFFTLWVLVVVINSRQSGCVGWV